MYFTEQNFPWSFNFISQMLKRIILALCIAGFFKIGFAQHPDWDKVDVTYLQLPLMPVSPMAKNYSMQVYSNQNTNSNTGYIPINRSVNTVASQLTIAGCTPVTTTLPDFTVLVMFSGFQITSATPQSNYTVINGAAKYQYFYQISYLNAVTVQVVDGNGTMVRQFTVNNTDKILSRTSPYFNSSVDANNWFYNNYLNAYFFQSCDNEAYQRAVTNTQNQLNNELGYLVKTIHVEVAGMKNKPEYNDLNQAFTTVSSGYDLLSSNKDKAFDNILQATLIWEKALLESNMTDKKARINDHITEALYENLAVGYCFLEQWDLSQQNLQKLAQLNIGGSLENKIKKAQELKSDYMMRVTASKLKE